MGIESNIWKLKADRFIASCWIFASLLVPYYQENGLAASQIYIVQAVFATVMVIFEIPMGYFSDVMGRRVALLLGGLLIPAGITTYALTHDFWGFVAAEVLIALGLSLRSGTDSAILYDTLKQVGKERSFKRIEGLTFFYAQLGNTVGNLAGSLVALLTLRFAFIVNALSSLILIPLSLSMVEPEREKTQAQSLKAHGQDLVRAIKFCGKTIMIRDAIFYWALINGVGMMGYWSNYLFYTKVGLPVSIFGIMAATCGFIAGVGGGLAHHVEKRWGFAVTCLPPLFMGVCYILIGWIGSIQALPLMIVTSFLWGLSIPLLRDILHKNTRSSIRATVLSIASMGGRLMYVVLAFALGRLIDETSVETGFIVLGAFFLLAGAIPALSLTRNRANSS